MSIHSLSNTIEAALARAGLDPRAGAAKAALDVVRKALADARIDQLASTHDAPAADHQTIDVEARVIDDDAPTSRPIERPGKPGRGDFLPRVHTSVLGRRAYRLYVPSGYRGEAMPLVVMLHGCKQNPEDFAAGTRFNDIAEELGFFVAYPAQPAKANGSNCWNWFEPQHQTRSGAEPAIIAAIVAEIAQTYRIEQRRVFVAGLSAGAAMAVILGETHPELFAAVGAHSGLPYGAASDVASAFAAMGGRAPVATRASPHDSATPGVPTIVFHGDRDTTVVLHNGDAIAAQAVARFEAGGNVLTANSQEQTSNRRRATRITHLDISGHALVEQWIVHGGTHAWSGGNTAGSFTDANGPDASREMARFFLQDGAP